jgi:Zn finger protein HypA/HybF involved in hydrogenase expression
MEGAALDIERVPAACRCEQCGSDFPARDFSMACPRCASPRIVIAGGDELALAYLEIEDDGRGEAPSEGARS